MLTMAGAMMLNSVGVAAAGCTLQHLYGGSV